MNRKRVMVVDDSSTVRMQIGEMLQERYEVLFAGDGAEALALAQRQKPDAVVSDLEMPGMDGAELLRNLRKHEGLASVPVIIATTVMAVDRVNQCRQMGCAGFVLKPIQREYLLAKLGALLKD